MLKVFPKTKVLLLLIILAGLFLRFYRFEQRFDFDAELNVKSWAIVNLINGKYSPLVGTEAVSYLHHLFYPPFFLYFGALMFLITNNNPLSIEFFLIILSAFSIILIFKATASFSGKRAGIIACVIFSFSFFIANAEKFAWIVGSMVPLSLGIFFTTQKMTTSSFKKMRSFVILGALIGIGLNLHYQTLIILCSVIAWFFVNNRKKIKSWNLIVFILPIVFFISPLFIFDLRHDYFNLRGVLLLLTKNQSDTMLSNFVGANLAFGKTFLAIFQNETINVRPPFFLIFILNLFILFLPVWIRSRLRKDIHRNIMTFIAYEFLFAYLILPFVQNRHYSSEYYLIFLLPIFVILISFLLFQVYLKNKLIAILLISFFAFLNFRAYLIYQEVTPIFKTKEAALAKIVQQNRQKNKLTIYSSIPSGKYSFLLYRACQQANYDYKKIQLFEPWNKPQKYDLIINQATFL